MTRLAVVLSALVAALFVAALVVGPAKASRPCWQAAKAR